MPESRSPTAARPGSLRAPRPPRHRPHAERAVIGSSSPRAARVCAGATAGSSRFPGAGLGQGVPRWGPVVAVVRAGGPARSAAAEGGREHQPPRRPASLPQARGWGAGWAGACVLGLPSPPGSGPGPAAALARAAPAPQLPVGASVGVCVPNTSLDWGARGPQGSTERGAAAGVTRGAAPPLLRLRVPGGCRGSASEKRGHRPL